MKNPLVVLFLFGFSCAALAHETNEQFDPTKGDNVEWKGEEDQIDPNRKNNNSTSSVNVPSDKRTTGSNSNNKPKFSVEEAKIFSNTLVNLMHQEYINSKRQTFFTWPFSLDLK